MEEREGLREDRRASHGGWALHGINTMLAENATLTWQGSGQPQSYHQLGTGKNVEAAGGVFHFPKDHWGPDRLTEKLRQQQIQPCPRQGEAGDHSDTGSTWEIPCLARDQ